VAASLIVAVSTVMAAVGIVEATMMISMLATSVVARAVVIEILLWLPWMLL